MNEAEFEKEVKELLKEFDQRSSLRTGKLKKLAQKTQDPRLRAECNVNSLQELLDYLRVCIKYQVFDLEAMRRENEFLRKLLKENNR